MASKVYNDAGNSYIKKYFEIMNYFEQHYSGFDDMTIVIEM